LAAAGQRAITFPILAADYGQDYAEPDSARLPQCCRSRPPGTGLMPRRIEPSRAALADFDALYDYIARDNPRAAAQVRRAHSIARSNSSRISQHWEGSFVIDDTD
jgi:hypothetical protein